MGLALRYAIEDHGTVFNLTYTGHKTLVDYFFGVKSVGRYDADAFGSGSSENAPDNGAHELSHPTMPLARPARVRSFSYRANVAKVDAFCFTAPTAW